jgi:PII-like signaling protein
MKLDGEGFLLRIYLGEQDKWHHTPLYEAIVLEARKRGLAGATVLRGSMGFGAHSHMHTAKILRLSEDLPVLIEIVDKEDNINAFLPALDEMLGDGLVTLEKVRVLTYRATPKT